MAGARPPGAVARVAVGFAVRPLPDLDDRLRYRAEFTADLHTLDRLAQWRYAAGIASQTHALRAALVSAPGHAVAEALSSRPAFSVRCRLLRLHTWVARSAEDGGRYLACRRCGQESWYGWVGGRGSPGGGPTGGGLDMSGGFDVGGGGDGGGM